VFFYLHMSFIKSLKKEVEKVLPSMKKALNPVVVAPFILSIGV